MKNAVDVLVKLDVVIRLTGVKKSKIYKDIADGKHPKPIKRGRSSLWSLNEITQFVEAQKASRSV